MKPAPIAVPANNSIGGHERRSEGGERPFIRRLLAAERFLHPRLFALLMRATRPLWGRRNGLVVSHFGAIDLYLDLREGAERETFLHRYDPPLSRFVGRWCRPGDVFIDVGANAGQFTALAAAAVGATGRIVAFEPNPCLAARLQRFTEHNALSNVAIRGTALADRSGRAALHVSSSHPYSSLDLAHLPNYPIDCIVEVAVSTLDNEFSNTGNRRKIDLLKIDAQGLELRILQGGVGLLRDNPPEAIVIETVAEQTIGMFELLRGFGYRPFTIEERDRSIALAPCEHLPAAGSNVIWRHQESRRQLADTDSLTSGWCVPSSE